MKIEVSEFFTEVEIQELLVVLKRVSLARVEEKEKIEQIQRKQIENHPLVGIMKEFTKDSDEGMQEYQKIVEHLLDQRRKKDDILEQMFNDMKLKLIRIAKEVYDIDLKP